MDKKLDNLKISIPILVVPIIFGLIMISFLAGVIAGEHRAEKILYFQGGIK